MSLPDLLVGPPILSELGTQDAGRAGELLVAYCLERNGIQASLVNRIGSDLWVLVPPDGPLFKLEVKSAQWPTNRGRGSLSYSFQVKMRDADWYAFVALDRSSILFRPRGWLKEYQTQRIAPEEFTSEAMSQSLAEMITDVRTQKKEAEASRDE